MMNRIGNGCGRIAIRQILQGEAVIIRRLAFARRSDPILDPSTVRMNV